MRGERPQTVNRQDHPASGGKTRQDNNELYQEAKMRHCQTEVQVMLQGPEGIRSNEGNARKTSLMRCQHGGITELSPGHLLHEEGA